MESALFDGLQRCSQYNPQITMLLLSEHIASGITEDTPSLLCFHLNKNCDIMIYVHGDSYANVFLESLNHIYWNKTVGHVSRTLTSTCLVLRFFMDFIRAMVLNVLGLVWAPFYMTLTT